MHIKFHAVGGGSASEAADYLVAERDGSGQLREGVEVLRGDPYDVAAVADSLEFEHKYTSGVIAWAPEDEPSEAEVNEVLEEFEETAWAGLAPDRYAWTAVEHRSAGGGVHVHVLAARCDLESGKSLNIAAPGWQRTFDALRDWQNHEHSWSRPDDPARAREVQPGHRAYIEAARVRSGLAGEKDPRSWITEYLTQRIESGLIADRAGVVSALRGAGLEVRRQGRHYLTAADPDGGGKWRLKGAIYEQDFQRDRLERSPAAEDRAGTETDRGGDAERTQEARKKLEAERQQRARYHRERYPAHQRGAQAGLDQTAGDRPDDLWGHRRRELGTDRVVVEQHREPYQDAGRSPGGDRGATPYRREAQGEDLGLGSPRKQGGAEVRGTAQRDAQGSALDRGRAACRVAIERVKELYDRARETLDRRLESALRAVRAGAKAAGRAGRGFAEANAAARNTGRGLATAAQTDRSAGRGFKAASGTLGRRLQEDRQSVERSLNHIRKMQRQRGPEQYFGPSR